MASMINKQIKILMLLPIVEKTRLPLTINKFKINLKTGKTKITFINS